MAHCNYIGDDEIRLLKKHHVMVAHCPCSNLDLGSGIMPLRKLKDAGLEIGLGSDISGGHTLNLATVMKTAVEVSKLRYLANPQESPATIPEALYLATKGGGAFWGNTGSFEKGYSFDALVICDEDTGRLNLQERLEKFIYAGDYRQIKARYLKGVRLDRPCFSE